MPENKIIKCSCGWELKSPMGEEDLLYHGKLHADKAHPEMNLSKEDLKGYIEKSANFFLFFMNPKVL